MKVALRLMLLVLALPPLLSQFGCGGGVPATGSQAINQPGHTLEKEKEIGEGFRKTMMSKPTAKRSR